MNCSVVTNYQCSGYTDETPSETKYFKNFIVEDFINICKEKQDIITIISIKSNLTVDNIELCENELEIKNNHKVDTSSLLIVYLKMSFQIKYVGGSDSKSVYVENTNFYKIVYLPLPKIINNRDIQDYFRKNRITTQVYVEDLQTSTVTDSLVKFSLLGFLNILFIQPNN